MRPILDTHAPLCFLAGDPRLPERAREAMAAAGREERAPVGEVSAIELATKRRLGRLPRADAITLDVEPAIVGNGFRAPPISMAHAALAGRLGIPHKGPSDRLLIAQSLIENAPPVSKETLFDAAGVTRPW